MLGNLDGIVKNTIEKVGTRLTGTEVSLEDVILDLGSGSVALEGLQIDNPKGYKSDFAFLLKKITVAVDTSSLSKPVIQLDEVTVEGARLNVEQHGETNNLTDLLAQVEANAKPGSNAQEQEAPPQDEPEAGFILKRFVFANTSATLISDTKGNKAIEVPDVKRSNIGDPTQGLTPEQLGDALLQAVLEEVEAAVADHLAGLAKKALKDSIRAKMGLSEKN